LPFRFSNCWHLESVGSEAPVLSRVDVGLIGLLFEGSTRVRLAWVPSSECLGEDAELAEEAALVER
jgi:hypothetical protein